MTTKRILAAALALLLAAPAHAETVRIARQFGISYLPLILMKHDHLLEEEGKARGLELRAEWLTFTGGPPINDALISGNIELAAGGVSAMLILRDRTRGAMRVSAIAALGNMPIWLNTSNQAVHSIADFTPADRIALPGVKISMQAVILQMACRQAFGPGQEYRLDPLTATMGHPDGMTALLSANSQVTAHFTSAPYMYQELQSARIHRVLDSYDVLGGPHSFNLVWTTARYHDEHPRVIEAFVAALDRAMAEINADPATAAAVWIEEEHARLTAPEVADIIRKPENEWTTTPKRVLAIMQFMHDAGALQLVAGSWRDLFFPEGQRGDGS